MSKIIELVIDFENFEFEDLGATIISLVDSPAIEVNWLRFAKEQFVERIPGESQEAYLDRCIPQLISEGMEEDQAVAVCYNTFKSEPSEDHQNLILQMAADDTIGEVIDPSEIIYMDLAALQFDELGNYPKLIDGVKVLQGLDPKTPVDVVYRYTGPSAQRFFCRTLKALNKVYSYNDMLKFNSLPFNPGFGQNKAAVYDIFEFKGGPNCKHYWEALLQFYMDGKRVLFSLGPAEGDAGKTNNKNYQSPAGAVEHNAWLRQPQASRFWAFASDEKQIITGPAMIPNQLILRKDEKGNPFHVYFSKETIERIALKFLADNNTHNTDVNHDNNVVNENTLLESWIIEDPEKDKSSALGFDLPKGTWMVSYKINNPETWQKIKRQELNGFSIEGQFIEKLQQNG